MEFGVQYNEIDIPFIRFTRAPFIDEQNLCFKTGKFIAGAEDVTLIPEAVVDAPIPVANENPVAAPRREDETSFDVKRSTPEAWEVSKKKNDTKTTWTY